MISNEKEIKKDESNVPAHVDVVIQTTSFNGTYVEIWEDTSNDTISFQLNNTTITLPKHEYADIATLIAASIELLFSKNKEQIQKCKEFLDERQRDIDRDLCEHDEDDFEECDVCVHKDEERVNKKELLN